MRILLVGEYSGFHNSLKYGLTQLGHEVTILGDGDGFKKFPVDIDISSDYFRKDWLRHKVRVGWYKLTGNDLDDSLRFARFRESGIFNNHYDIIQFINSNALKCQPLVERKMIDILLSKNSKFFLTACGDDYRYAKYLTEHHTGYSILNPEPDKPSKKQELEHTLKYLKDNYRENYEAILKASQAIIPTHTDFKMALVDESKATELIPCAVKTQEFSLQQNENLDVIEIFLGINRNNYDKKGIIYFEKGLELIKEKFGSRVNITIAEDLPYNEYIQSYNNAHILLDQVLSYDQGYNALEAMAQGKVVFAGAGEPFLDAYDLEKAPLIDARPNVEYLVNQLSQLIENPESILSLGKEARAFILKHHDAVKIAKKYEALYE